ncbi:MAG: glycosyltransferase family 4 protein, partial [Sediminibacterium sp.]
AVQDHWIKKSPSLISKALVIYNGISSVEKSNEANFKTQYLIPDGAMVIGMAGRVHYWKGQQYFLKIAQQILKSTAEKNEYPSIYFIMTGDAFPGYEYLVDEMKDFIEKNQLGDRIFFTGFEDKMDKFYTSIHLLILPSQLPDPLPTVVLESMQYGIPVVATEQGGAKEMILENETGIFIPINNVQVAASKILALLQTKNLSQMGTHSMERVKKYFSESAFETQIATIFHK